MKSYTIKALTPLGVEKLENLKPSTGGIKRSKLYDDPLTYLYEAKSKNIKRFVTAGDVKVMTKLMMRPAQEIRDYNLEVEE
jgi:hypothetical protein